MPGDAPSPAPVLDPASGTMVTVPATVVEDDTTAFRPAILGVRATTTVVTILLTGAAVASLDTWVLFWATIVVTYNMIRIIKPLVIRDDISGLLRVLGEVIVHVFAVVATGYWESPFVFSLLTAIMVAGFARGFAFAVRVGVASTMAVTVPHLITDGPTAEALRTGLQWTTLLLLVAAVAGYARHIMREADRQHTVALDRLGRLSDANTLLFALHRVAQTLPSSLDLDDVLDSTMSRIEDLFTYDVAAVLVLDASGGGWLTARSDGGRLPASWPADGLPGPARAAVDSKRLRAEDDLSDADGPGLAVDSRCGLYAPLVGRERVVGMVVVERNETESFTDREIELLRGFVGPAGLAVDNALWFARLRTVGADEERTRIARDLHDRIGQSLAYLSFELDRIVKADARGDDVGPALAQLRTDVRGVVSEVRDTLYDLRTDVTDESDLPTTLREQVARVGARSKVRMRTDLRDDARLPLRQEREMFRIAQEALANVERHSGASTCLVRWWCDESGALLEVRDDGRGFASRRAGRLDSYGILGMRERAASIGATLDVDSIEGVGTTIRCQLLVDDG